MQNNEINIENIRISLSTYMKYKGYTILSLSNKCDISSSLLSLFFTEKLSMKQDLRDSIVKTVLEVENITLEELLLY